MQEPRMVSPEELAHSKLSKKKTPSQFAPSGLKKGDTEKGKLVSAASAKRSKKSSKRSPNDGASQGFQHTNVSSPDSFVDTSMYSADYRTLRHQYLLLEDESFSLDRELGVMEAEVKALEEEKFALLDQLVVLEGLMDPSELKPQ